MELFNLWELSFVGWLIVIIGFVLSSGLLILVALFYDHRNNSKLLLKYILGLTAFVLGGFLLVNYFPYFALIAVPILVWVYFFYMFWTKRHHHPNENK